MEKDLFEWALKYGPYFFSIFLLTVVWTKTRRDLNKAIEKRDKENDKPKEQKDTLAIRVASRHVINARIRDYLVLGSGLLLTFAGVFWWIHIQPVDHIFRAQLMNIYDYHKTSSTDFYIKKQIHEKYRGEESQVRNESLLIIQKAPFIPGNKYSLKLSKGGRKIYIFDIPYTDKGVPRYVFIEKGEKIVLKLKEVVPISINWFVGTAWAKESIADSADVIMPRVEITEKSLPLDSINKIIHTIQSVNTPVGLKIDALDAIAQSDEKSFEEMLSTNLYQEFVVTTLLDLTRHSDKELASKARKLFSPKGKDYNVGKELAKFYKLNKINKEDLEEIITRASQEQAISIMINFTANTNVKWAKALKTKVVNGEIKHLALVPTGSARGDKYYVKATWNPKDDEVVSCLTKLFNDQLASQRSLADEQVLMKGKSERYVYWYSKEWALLMHERIKECGGDASFIGWR